jgi:hypothetical protein
VSWFDLSIFSGYEKLRAKIEEQVINGRSWVLTGPVFLKIMLDVILASLAQSMHGLTEHFKSITPKDFDGENISEDVSFAQGIYDLLVQNDAEPIDSIQIVSKALQQVATKEFATFIQLMYAIHQQKSVQLRCTRC